ncbi:Na+/H+ antiporter subunit E [Ostreibacterium oceani]|uniref:Cation:proton antiporter n=1 Tax=Ostreibacterium oceani TaxID=2654998 RepID=A0A6N7EVK8_9GAMM|nr:Na+/H+ antiporter subunit E [Ostreibacterium oceani]MPV86512.1 cation:proton antiporter [Ostreibacterium oceani]
MKLLIPHFILAFALAYIAQGYLPFDIGGNGYLLLMWGIFTLTWPLSYLFAKTYFVKLPRLVNLIVFFIKELFMANLRVAYDVVTPTTYMRPCVVAVPLDAKTDIEITILACMISLTPGTLSLGLSEDRSLLFVHAITFSTMDPEAIKQELKQGFEQRLLRVTR